MCVNAVDNYAHALGSVTDCLCFKAVTTYTSAIQFVPNRFRKCVIKLLLLVDFYLILFMINI